MNKLIYEFLKKRTYTNYQLVVDYVKTKIDFCKLNNDVNKLTLYLLSDTGKIVVSYKNGVFSTLCDFAYAYASANVVSCCLRLSGQLITREYTFAENATSTFSSRSNHGAVL